MSPNTTDRWKEAVRSVCAIVVLLALFWLCRSGLFARGNGGDGELGVFRPALTNKGDPYLCHSGPDGNYEDEGRDTTYSHIFSMPICADLGELIETIPEARNDLLKAVVDQDAQAITAATAQYREAVQEVQTGFSKLKMRLEPDQFSYVCHRLLASCDTGDGQPLMPCELGQLAENIGE